MTSDYQLEMKGKDKGKSQAGGGGLIFKKQCTLNG
ncbi:hypothetical protein GGE45_005906 [Rhizobium aethiopicum]|nr:hypothetical protein [Rhizobium aethiopicum]